MAFFETIYSWFHNFYNDVMWDTVREIISDNDELLFADSLYVVGIVTLVVSLLIAVAFYIWPINNPSFKSWKSWIVMLLISMLLNFGVGVGMGYSRVQSVSDDEEACVLILGDDYDGQALTDETGINNYLGFGLSNLFVGSIFFMVCCIPLTFYNGNAKFLPFRK